MIVAALLRADKVQRGTYLDFVGSSLELRNTQAENMIILCGAVAGGTLIGFRDWLERLGSVDPQSVRVIRAGSAQPPKLPDHIAAAFGSSGREILFCSIQGQKHLIDLTVEQAPRYAMSGVHLAALIDAQLSAPAMWRRIEALTNENRAMNLESTFEMGMLRSAFIAGELDGFLELMLDQLLEEFQIELAISGEKLLIPDELEHLLHPPASHDADSMAGEVAVSSVYLYPTGRPTGEELARFIGLQPIPDLEPILSPSLAEAGINIHTLLDLSAEEVAERAIADTVCRILADELNATGTKPLIPENLLHVFGPSALDQKRADLRGQWGRFYTARPSANTWQRWICRECPIDVAELSATKLLRKPEVLVEWKAALAEIEKYAREIDSPFSGTFALARILIDSSYGKRMAEEIASTASGEELEERWIPLMIEAGFDTDNAAAAASSIVQGMLSAELLLQVTPPEDLPLLVAVSSCDVFGGMGSWNDIDPRDMNERYSTLSTRLYHALRNTLMVLT